MNHFLNVNKTLLTFSLITLILVPIFGLNFLVTLIGNILIILLLIPVLLFLLVFIGFKSYKFKINNCNSCGSISLGLSDTCTNCGADLGAVNNKNQSSKKPSESTIEVEAEEIK